MENKNHHIDDFLKEKMQELHFEVNEQHWADAQRRLDDEDKKKRPFWLFFIVFTLLIGTALTALNNYSGSKKSNDVYPAIVKKASKQNAIQKENKLLTVQNQQEEIGDHAIKQARSAALAGTDEAVQLSKNVNQSEPLAFQKKNQTQAMASSSVVEKNENQSRSRINKLAINKNKDLVTANQNLSLAKQQMNKPIAEITKQQNRLSQNMDSPKSAKASQYPVQMVSAETIQNEETQEQSTGETFVRNAVAMLGDKRVYRSAEDYQKLNPRYIKGLENYTYTKTVIPLGKEQSDSIRNEINGVSAANKSAQAPPKKDAFVFQPQPSTFYLIAGLGLAQGYRGNSSINGSWGFSPNLGLGYQFSLSDRMSIYLSAYMSYISNLNITEEGKRISYSFDKDSTLLSVTRKNLLQMHLPLQFAYKLRPRLSIFGGAGVNFGLNSISIYEDSKLNTQERRFGYMNGLRFVDVNANAGLEYEILPQLCLGAFYQQGFVDITKNDYFNNTHNDRNARGGIMVRYKFKKQ